MVRISAEDGCLVIRAETGGEDLKVKSRLGGRDSYSEAI
nr:hypothetical protein [Serratia proteamaculans]